MIRTFADKETENFFRKKTTRKFPPDIAGVALRKLTMINAAADLDFLRVPPGNRLEALKGDRIGQYSIRINERWRICFVWQNGNAFDVEIVDYH